MGISKTYKIIDCFTFYNEIDLLNLRLSELYDYVDYFVISESLHTHRGKSKKLYLEENMDLFSQFKDKIINVCDKTKYNSSDYSWKIENNQRNEIAKGLSSLDLDDNDQILISDLDEIPNIETLKKVMPVEWVFTLEMDFYYFTLYNKIKKNWKKSKILNYKVGDFPLAEKICNKVISIPFHQYLKEDEKEYIVKNVNSFYETELS